MSSPSLAEELPKGMPQPGEVFVGKYRIERVLGIGGMGVVFAAVHMGLDERVALKLIRPECAEPEFVVRFMREGRAVVKIRSEHVARVLDVSTDDRGHPYLVMEHLHGHDLSSVVGSVPFTTAVDYVVQACDALAHAHALGIVHRDIKPSNLFAATELDGTCVKVLDFGIAKAPVVAGSAGNFALTRTGGTMGSPLYMSPEQIRSLREVDNRADIWSLGVVLFELVTGAMPFEGHSLTALAASIMVDSPLSMRTMRPDVPPGLDAVVARCLEKPAERRFANVAELARALAPFGDARTAARVDRIVRIVGASSERMRAHATGPASNPMSVGGGAPVGAMTQVDPAQSDGPFRQTAGAWGGSTSSSGGNRRAVAIALVVLAALIGATTVLFGVSALRSRAAKQAAAAVESAPPASAAAPLLPASAVVPSVEAEGTTTNEGASPSDSASASASASASGAASASAATPPAAAAAAAASASASASALAAARKGIRPPAATPRPPLGTPLPPPPRGEPTTPAPPPTTSSGLVRNRHGG